MRSLPLRKLIVLTALLLISSSLFATPGASAQSAVRDFGSEASFLASLNSQRAAGGLAPLTLNGSMTAAADGWALAMTNGSFLAHASDIVSGTPSGWNKVGENVGRGQSVSSLTTAFMNSPSHRANIMDPAYTHVGIAVYVHPTDGRIYTTHRFAALGAAAAPAPVVVEAPAPVATPVPPTPVPATPVPATPVPAAPEPVVAEPTPEEPTPVPATPAPATPAPSTPESEGAEPTEEPAIEESFGTPPEQLAFLSGSDAASPDEDDSAVSSPDEDSTDQDSTDQDSTDRDSADEDGPNDDGPIEDGPADYPLEDGFGAPPELLAFVDSGSPNGDSVVSAAASKLASKTAKAAG